MIKESKPYQMIFQVNWMLWGVLLSSQFFFIVMTLPIMRMDTMLKNLGEEANPLVPLPLYVVAGLILVFVSFYFHRRAYAGSTLKSMDANALVDSFKRFQMNNLFSWVFAETMTLVGIISMLFNAPQWIMFSLCLSGFSLQAYYYPRVGKFFAPFKGAKAIQS